jgi:2-amino-4-hydroxy-6-hydroxymethyldihydropteridine diphosphokinase
MACLSGQTENGGSISPHLALSALAVRTRFIIALGSNRRHARHGAPARVIEAALESLASSVVTRSRVIATAPIGPSLRRYANATALLETDLGPDDLLDHLKSIEAAFGRRTGQRWSARTLDLDIILWSDGCWSSPELTVPHPAFRQRDFVLRPLLDIAPDWRDPVSGRSMRQLASMQQKRRRKT